MKRPDIVGIIALILGIPGFLLVFFTGQMATGILTLLLALGVLGVAIYIYMRDRQPPFTIEHVENVLTIADAQGELAKYRGTRTIRAKQNVQVEYWIGGIVADGSVENILIDGRQPDAYRVTGGEKLVCKRYAPPLNRGDEDTLMLTMDYVDSFMNPSREVYGYKPAYVTREFTVRVEFDPGKPCHGAVAYMTHWGTMVTTRVAQPIVSGDGRCVELKIKNPKVGATYTLEWRW